MHVMLTNKDDGPSVAQSHPLPHPTGSTPTATQAHRPSTHQVLAQPETYLNGDAVDDPNRDYYKNVPWVRRFIYFILCHIALSTMQIIVGTTVGIINPLLLFIPLGSWMIINWLPIYNTLMLTLFVLFSLLIEDLRMAPGSKPIVRKRKELAEASTHINFAVFLFTAFSYWNLTLLEYGPQGILVILGVLVVTYFLCCWLVKVHLSGAK